jgi:hypothetical protein
MIVRLLVFLIYVFSYLSVLYDFFILFPPFIVLVYLFLFFFCSFLRSILVFSYFLLYCSYSLLSFFLLLHFISFGIDWSLYPLFPSPILIFLFICSSLLLLDVTRLFFTSLVYSCLFPISLLV